MTTIGVVVVARPDARGGLDEASLSAFLARAWQGVNYRIGTWHHPLLALGRGGDFIVVDRSGPGDNCEDSRLSVTYRIDPPTGWPR